MKSKGVPALIPFLIVISAIFIGILIWAYIETKKANPQMIQVGQAPKRGQTHFPENSSNRTRGFAWLRKMRLSPFPFPFFT